VKVNFKDTSKKDKPKSKTKMIIRTEAGGSEAITTKGISRNCDRIIIRGKSLLKPKTLKKQGLTMAKKVTDPVPKITSSPNQGRLLTPSLVDSL